MALGWPIAIICSFFHTKFRDFQQVMVLVMQSLYYISAVFILPEDYRKQKIGFLMDYNPIVHILNLIRAPLLDGQFPSMVDYGSYTLGASTAVLYAFRRIKDLDRRKNPHLLFLGVPLDFACSMPCILRMSPYPSKVYNALTLKEHVFNLLRLKGSRKILHDIHALRGLNLQINSGERLGIIGRNGAGKSTLLRTIAGIYPLQSGALETQGNIRSLFELNLGFELDASGRQNITYRGLLQGESPASIKAKEQEIIDFADLGEFIEYPVKTYSAGMMVRLAFAISTCSGGDILLLDEVLGAGDASFFAKARIPHLIAGRKSINPDFCLARLRCCQQACAIMAICMERGTILEDGPPSQVIAAYRNRVCPG